MFQYIPSLPPLFFFRPPLVKQRLDSFFKVAVHLQYQDFLRMERKKERKKGTKKIRAPNNVTDLKYPTVLINTQLVLVFTKFFPVSFDYYTTSRGYPREDNYFHDASKFSRLENVEFRREEEKNCYPFIVEARKGDGTWM